MARYCAAMGHDHDIAGMGLLLEPIDEPHGALVHVMDGFPAIGTGIDVHHTITGNARDARGEQTRRPPLGDAEAPFSEERVDLNRESESRGQYRPGLARATQVADKHCSDLRALEMLCQLLRLETTKCRQRRCISVSLHQTEGVPRTLSVPHQPERAFVAAVSAHLTTMSAPPGPTLGRRREEPASFHVIA